MVLAIRQALKFDVGPRVLTATWILTAAQGVGHNLVRRAVIGLAGGGKGFAHGVPPTRSRMRSNFASILSSDLSCQSKRVS